MAWLNRALASILLCLAISAGAQGPVVNAPAGAVSGERADGVDIFRGIPFALPPTGAGRWRPPEAVPAWREVRDATSFGPACYPAAGREPGSIYAEDYPPMSEDCLSLNIWAPADARNAPVFVWIHGGALVGGSGRQAMYDGAAMARRGIVVVSINYRLGVLGYLAHPALSAESRRQCLRQLRPARPDRGAALGQVATSRPSAAIRPTSPSPGNRRARSASCI